MSLKIWSNGLIWKNLKILSTLLSIPVQMVYFYLLLGYFTKNGMV